MDLTPTERWSLVSALFSAALDRPAPEREAFVAEAAASEAVRAEVLHLLRAHADADGFLDEVDPAAAATLVTSADGPLNLGEAVGPYRLVRELGRGGMGVVYLAEDTRLDRPVALKFLAPHLSADERARRRLVGEAKAASALDHPNVAVVHEIAEAPDGGLYIALAYYEGETLRERIDRGPVPVAEAVGIARQIAAGLGAAHAAGVIHRDVKPSNVVLTREGVAKVVDFGIARARGADVTTGDATPGTAAYMSPEQTQPGPIDARADLWSVGVVLYEMLAGMRPFGGDTVPSALHAIRYDAPRPIRSLRPDVPKALAAVVERCLQKNPDARYPDAAALVAALDGTEGGARSPRAQRRWIGATLLVAALVAGAAALWPRLGHDRVADRETQRLVVLPLDDGSADPADAYFAAGLTEELTSRLAKLRGLRVLSASTARQLDGESRAAIRDAVGASAVLEGSARLTEERVRVSVRLVDTDTEAALWAEDFDSPLGDVLDVQTAVAERVAEALALEIRAADRARLGGGGTDDPEAFRTALRARHAWNARTPDAMLRARALYEDAIDRDPAYAGAWAGLASVYITLAGYDVLPPDEAYPRARAAADRALDIDPDHVEAHLALAGVASDAWDWIAADRHYREALARDPMHAGALTWYSEFLAQHGHFREALAMAQRAQDADPFSLLAHADEGRVYYLWRRYDEAAAHFEETLERGDHFVASLYRGLALLNGGHLQRAIPALEEAHDRYPYPDVKGVLAGAYARAGRERDARRLVDEILDARRAGNADAFVLAAAYVGLGETDTAIDWLEAAYEERNWQMIFLQTEPTFDPLRDAPRFQSLVRRVGTLEER